jgi:hypothetical protein
MGHSASSGRPSGVARAYGFRRAVWTPRRAAFPFRVRKKKKKKKKRHTAALIIQGIQEVLSMRPITSHSHFHLEHGRTTSLVGVVARNGITTLSVLLRDLSVIPSLQRAINTLPTLPRLRALHVEVPRDLKDECEVVSSVVFGLLRAVQAA